MHQNSFNNCDLKWIHDRTSFGCQALRYGTGVNAMSSVCVLVLN